jgi:hypothetical protein
MQDPRAEWAAVRYARLAGHFGRVARGEELDVIAPNQAAWYAEWAVARGEQAGRCLLPKWGHTREMEHLGYACARVAAHCGRLALQATADP